jgi:hypothetical protein
MAKVLSQVQKVNAEVRRREKQRKKETTAAAAGLPPPPPAPAAGAPRQKWTLTPLAQGVPKCGKRGQPPSAFVSWFDSLTPAQLKAHMDDRGDPDKKVKGARERIKEEARKGPLGQAGAHEWLKCSQLEKVKQFGFSMGDVWKTATPTHETDGPRWSHPTSGDPGHQSTQTHKELDAIFEKSITREEFLTHLNHWADGKDHDPPQPRLHHGRHSLPEDLQKHR